MIKYYYILVCSKNQEFSIIYIKNCKNGFYVYAKPTLTNNQDVLKYIARYLGRPVMPL